MGDRCRDDVTAPTIFDRQAQADVDAKIADAPRLGQAAELADLDIDGIHRLVVMGAQ